LGSARHYWDSIVPDLIPEYFPERWPLALQFPAQAQSYPVGEPLFLGSGLRFRVLERQFPAKDSPFLEWFGQAWVARRRGRMASPIQTGQ